MSKDKEKAQRKKTNDNQLFEIHDDVSDNEDDIENALATVTKIREKTKTTKTTKKTVKTVSVGDSIKKKKKAAGSEATTEGVIINSGKNTVQRKKVAKAEKPEGEKPVRMAQDESSDNSKSKKTKKRDKKKSVSGLDVVVPVVATKARPRTLDEDDSDFDDFENLCDCFKTTCALLAIFVIICIQGGFQYYFMGNASGLL